MRDDSAWIYKLDPTFRTTLFTRLSKELSMREIVDDLDVSLAATKSRVYRARNRLM
jgi:DNA-directed RNA polymerase specialized sigma24 family protein